MSTLKATNLQHKDSSDPNVVLYADGSTSIRNLQNLANNVIINGACDVSQRGGADDITQATHQQDKYGGADRYHVAISGSYQVDLARPASDGAARAAGFGYCQRVTNDTAIASPASSNLLLLSQGIEGVNLAEFGNGTSAAKKYSISFWVRSSVAGTYAFELFANHDGVPNKNVAINYTISAAEASAATWKFVSHTFDADTAQAYVHDNGGRLYAQWWLSAGNQWTGGGVSDAWQTASDSVRAPNQVNWAATAGAVFAITGVQLTATDAPIAFQFEDYGMSVKRCERYFETISAFRHENSRHSNVGWTNTGFSNVRYKTAKRVNTPDISLTNFNNRDNCQTVSSIQSSADSCTFQGTVINATYPYYIWSGVVQVKAEL